MANDAEKGDKGRKCSHSPQCFEKSRCNCPHTSILGQPRLPNRTQGEVWWRKCGATAFAFKDRWLGALGALVTSSLVGLVGQTLIPIRRCTAYRSPDRIGQGRSCHTMSIQLNTTCKDEQACGSSGQGASGTFATSTFSGRKACRCHLLVFSLGLAWVLDVPIESN